MKTALFYEVPDPSPRQPFSEAEEVALLKSKRQQSPDLPPVPYTDCPAKTFLTPGGEIRVGRSVPEHCQIVGDVSRELVQRFPAELRSLFPKGTPLVAALHDLGKVSPYFFEKICRACTTRPPHLPEWKALNVHLESEWGGHAGVSQVAAEALGASRFIPEILGQHHGASPPVTGMRADSEAFGRQPWQTERERLVQDLMERLEVPSWPEVTSAAQARLLAGLTTVADWIGSGEFFEDPTLDWQGQVAPALEHAGFLTPTFRKGLSFEQVFGFAPRSAQTQFLDAVSGSGAYVLEAPMGMGKTEAALFAAYQLLQAGTARGIYFALPTQLTSNRIHQRFNAFLSAILDAPEAHHPLLLHGQAHLLETDLGEEGRPGGAWFQQAKRGLLAPFAVGTVDQALMAAMNVRHGFVRAFGLAGKVVILDEIHTYDAYTGTILDALVELLVSLRCTVLILSATLSRSRRAQILGTSVLSSEAYPLVTAVPSPSGVIEVPLSPPPSREVSVHAGPDAAAIEEALCRAEQGQQVLWVENTVREAQQRYLDLAARAAEVGVASGLVHSRYTPDHRSAREGEWVALYGKEGWSQRPQQGRILVGTQVLEQSLDIDADFLVSRFAPTDLLLQRLGRLWRHSETPRPKSASCEAWWLAPERDQAVEAPDRAFGPSAFVYSPYVLCRSLEVWEGVSRVSLPGDLRALVEATYEAREEAGPMRRWQQELETGTVKRTGVQALRQLASLTLSTEGVTLPDTETATRYSDQRSVEVLLLGNLELVSPTQETCLTTIDGVTTSLPWHRHRLSRKVWRRLSLLLMRQVLTINFADAPEPLPLESLKKFGLQHCLYLGPPNQSEAALRVALVGPTGQLYSPFGKPLSGLEYRPDLGYRKTSTPGG